MRDVWRRNREGGREGDKTGGREGRDGEMVREGR